MGVKDRNQLGCLKKDVSALQKCVDELKNVPPELPEECECAYEFVQSSLSVSSISEAGIFIYPNYGGDDPSQAGYNPSPQVITDQSKQLIAYTEDGEVQLCVRMGEQDTDGQISGSEGMFGYFHSGFNGSTGDAPPVGHSIANVKSTGCGIIACTYLHVNDIDASPSEYIETANLPPFSFTANHGNFNQTGTRFDPIGENQLLQVKFDDPVPTDIDLIVGKDSENGGQGVVVYFVDYYRPLKKCGEDWINCKGEIVTSPVMSSDLVAQGFLADSDGCCSSMAPKPSFALPAPPAVVEKPCLISHKTFDGEPANELGDLVDSNWVAAFNGSDQPIASSGQINGAYDFNSQGYYGVSGDPNGLQGSAATISFWAKFEDIAGGYRGVITRSSASGFYFGLNQNPNNIDLRWQSSSSGGTTLPGDIYINGSLVASGVSFNYVEPAPIVPGQWYHFAITTDRFDNVDGDWFFGSDRDISGRNSDAEVDDFAIFDSALPLSDIRKIYENGLDGTPASAIAKSGSLSVTKAPLYEYRDIWAEESGGTGPNSAEWSFGNGATGFIGLPIDAGWEVEALAFHADTYAATATIQVDLMNYGNVPSNAAANTIASISLSSATDGGGATNNAYKYESLATPVPISVTGTSTVIGFITRGETGNISDARIYARLRRQIGDYVSDVNLVNS